jgi:hypothetical protein
LLRIHDHCKVLCSQHMAQGLMVVNPVQQIHGTFRSVLQFGFFQVFVLWSGCFRIHEEVLILGLWSVLWLEV